MKVGPYIRGLNYCPELQITERWNGIKKIITSKADTNASNDDQSNLFNYAYSTRPSLSLHK